MATRFLPLLLWAILAAGCRSVAQPPIRANAPDIRRIHPAPGTSIVRFQELDEGVYKGSKPKSEADYEFLQSKHIKYIVDLKFFPWLNTFEKRKAKAHGMTLLTGTISASPMEPSETQVNHVLCLMRDKRYQPIYVHCDLGRDRAGLIAGLYDVYYRGMSKDQAHEDMEHYGFKAGWGLRGLRAYFEKHSKPPIEEYVPHCPAPASAEAHER